MLEKVEWDILSVNLEVSASVLQDIISHGVYLDPTPGCKLTEEVNWQTLSLPKKQSNLWCKPFEKK